MIALKHALLPNLWMSELERRYPNLSEVTTERSLSETELRLKLEIEQSRIQAEQIRADLSKEIAQVKIDLTKEIERLRADLSKETAKNDLTKEIERFRADLSKEIAQTKVDLLKWSFAFWATNFSAILLVLIWRVFD